MHNDIKYQGIYRGVVVNSNDPEFRNRLILKVPQIFGEEVTNWAVPVNLTTSSSEVEYGIFTRNTDYIPASTTTAYIAELDKTEDTGGGVYLGEDKSRIYVSIPGDYQILFSPQFSSNKGTNVGGDIWLRKNGVDVERSNSRINFQKELVTTIPFIIDLDAGDYVQVAFAVNDSTVKLAAFTNQINPTRPDIPSIIFNINRLGNALPLPGSTCWVMFEGGDPNFPVWLGRF